MIRRRLLSAVLAAGTVFFLGVLGSPLDAEAQTKPTAKQTRRVDVVKLMTFACPICRASESYDTVIERAVVATGGTFVSAPLPPFENDTSYRERVYFAARDIDPAMGLAVKASFYKAMQDMAQPLAQYSDIYSWLIRDLPQYDDSVYRRVFEQAQGEAAQGSLGRAARLAYSMGAVSVPSYILIVDNRPALLLDPDAVPGNSLGSLKDEVIANIRKHSQG